MKGARTFGADLLAIFTFSFTAVRAKLCSLNELRPRTVIDRAAYIGSEGNTREQNIEVIITTPRDRVVCGSPLM